MARARDHDSFKSCLVIICSAINMLEVSSSSRSLSWVKT